MVFSLQVVSYADDDKLRLETIHWNIELINIFTIQIWPHLDKKYMA